MKKILLFILLITLAFALPSQSAQLLWRNCLTGGGDCLDGIDGNDLADGDGAIVILDNSGTYEGYLYRLEDTAETESSPNVISPDSNAGNKRWRLVNIHAIGFVGPLTGAVTGNASTATALAANGANCNSGYAPLGVDASGAVESCFQVVTSAGDNTLSGSNTLSKVNAAGGSAQPLTISGTLGIMDGDDAWIGVTISPTNADHTGSNNEVRGVSVENITGDAQAGEYGVYVGTGWDYGFFTKSPLLIQDASGNSIILTPSAPSDYTGGVLTCDTDGTCDFADPTSFAGTGDLDDYILKSVITAEDDIVVGTAAATPGVISKGSNTNCFYGLDNAGDLACQSSFNPILVAAPAEDDTFSGTLVNFTAGENLAQWDVVYCKNVSGAHRCFKYDANGTDKAYPPRGIVTTAESEGVACATAAACAILLQGIARNDGWGQTTNQDEGKVVYASAETAGAISLTAPSTGGDMVAILGYVIEENVIYFNPSPILVEVP